MKAFLSHSSHDRDFVHDVAGKLKRARVWLDEEQIETAAEIRLALQRGIDSCDLFVIFLSKASLRSEWVNWELDQANKQLLYGKVHKIAPIIIDKDVSVDQVPRFLRNSKISLQTSPRLCAQDIQRLIQEQQIRNRTSLFIGRKQQIEEAELVLADPASDIPSVCMNFFGLAGC